MTPATVRPIRPTPAAEPPRLHLSLLTIELEPMEKWILIHCAFGLVPCWTLTRYRATGP